MMPELGELPVAEPTIICPNCKTEIKLTESLAAPLIAHDEIAANMTLAGLAGRFSVARAAP